MPTNPHNPLDGSGQAIRTFDDPVLKQVCELAQFSDDLAWLDLLQPACIANNGAGLAAPQIGIAKRAVYIRYGKEHGMILVNPVLSQLSAETAVREEGCLSYPGIYVPIRRHTSVFCEWQTPAGKSIGRLFKGFEAVVLQHEADHLDGICKVGDAWRNPPPVDSRLSGFALGVALGSLADPPPAMRREGRE